MNRKELHHLATQLSHPDGDLGIELAQNMNQTNIGMTRNAIANLDIKPGDHILELGHGNCGHLGEIMRTADGIYYHGFEVSQTMFDEAKKLESTFPTVNFTLYDGVSIPCDDNYFDRGFCVNTMYFWPDPIGMLNEIYRVLKPGGVFCLTFAEKEFMKQLPFTDDVFTLYSIDEAKSLISDSRFDLIHIDNQFEEVLTKAGHSVTRQYDTMVLGKKA